MAKTDLPKDKWKYSDLSNASDTASSTVTQDPLDYDPGHSE